METIRETWNKLEADLARLRRELEEARLDLAAEIRARTDALSQLSEARAEVERSCELIEGWIYAESGEEMAARSALWDWRLKFLANRTPPNPPGEPTCGEPYGPLPAMCRREAGHDGDCGSGTGMERAMAQFKSARDRVAHLAAKERLGEGGREELANLRFSAPSPPPAWSCPRGCTNRRSCPHSKLGPPGGRPTLEEFSRRVEALDSPPSPPPGFWHPLTGEPKA
jgi:hypothetical protein